MSNKLSSRPTLKGLAMQVRVLRERIEDMEDLMDLRGAVKRNGKKPGVAWEKVKKELSLD